MIAVIGLGGAGGNIADEAAKNGFASGAINFSQVDLDSLTEVKLKLRIPGSEGVGHNRDEAIRLMKENYEVAVNFIVENFSNPNIKILVFPLASSGGSGSGMGPILLDILSNIMDKTIVAFPIIPDKTEATVLQLNYINCFSELSSLGISLFPIDNDKIRDYDKNIGKNQIYKKSNEYAIKMLKILHEYTEISSKNGVFDKKDLTTILSTKGFGTISEVIISSLYSNISEEGISGAVQSSWESSYFDTPNYDFVMRAGIIFDGQDNLLEMINYDKIFNKFNKGRPLLDLFEGNYNRNNGKIITILAGMKLNHERLREAEIIIEESEKKIDEALSNDNQYRNNNSSLVNKISNNNSKKDVLSILGKYK